MSCSPLSTEEKSFLVKVLVTHVDGKTGSFTFTYNSIPTDPEKFVPQGNDNSLAYKNALQLYKQLNPEPILKTKVSIEPDSSCSQCVCDLGSCGVCLVGNCKFASPDNYTCKKGCN